MPASSISSRRSNGSIPACSRSSGGSRRNGGPCSSARRQSCGSSASLSEAEVQQLGSRVAKEAAERFGSVKQALKIVKTDERGGVSRTEVRNLFGEYGVSRRASDQLFDRLDAGGESTIAMNDLRGVLSERVNQASDGAGLDGDRTLKLPSQSQASTRSRSQPSTRSESDLSYVSYRSFTPKVFELQPRKQRDPPIDFETIVSNIGTAAGRKFKTCRDAFKSMDRDKTGIIEKPEVRRLFANYGYGEDAADQFYNMLDEDGQKGVSLSEFKEVFVPYIEPVASGKKCSDNVGIETYGDPTSQILGSITSKVGFEPQMVRGNEPVSKSELSKIANEMNQHLETKYVTFRQAFNDINRNSDGDISQKEMRAFFARYGAGSAVADQFYDSIDTNGDGKMTIAEFRKHFWDRCETVEKGRPLKADRMADSDDAGSRVHGNVRCTSSRSRPWLREEKPLTEEELDKAVENVCNAVGNKFTQTRSAFNAIDTERFGYISQNELRKFFQGYGYDGAAADQLMGKLDTDGNGKLMYNEFRNFFRTVFDPVLDTSPKATSRKEERRRSMTDDTCGNATSQVLGSSTQRIVDSMDRKKLHTDAELAQVVATMSVAAGQRYSTWRHAFRNIDRNQNGIVSMNESRQFFHGYGYGPATADQFFRKLDKRGTGEADLNDFAKHFAQHMDISCFSGNMAPEHGKEKSNRRRMKSPGWQVVRKGNDMEDNDARRETPRRETLRRSSSEPPKEERTPRDTSPRQSTRRDTSPRQSTRRDTSPRQSTPRDTSPRQSTPRDTSPRESTPRDASARRSEPRDYSPRGSTPRDTSPRQSTPRDTSPRQSTPRDASPRQSTPRDNSAWRSEPRDYSPRRSTPRDTSPRQSGRSTPRDTSPRQSGRSTPRDTSPRQSTQRDASPRQSTPRDTEAWRSEPRDYSPRRSTPQGTSPRRSTPRDYSPRSSACGNGSRNDSLIDSFRLAEVAQRRPSPAPSSRVSNDVVSERRYKEVKDVEVCAALGSIGQKAQAKHGSLRRALRRVTDNDDPTVTRDETKHFFKKYGYAKVADKFFDHVDREGRGIVNYSRFQEHFNRHVGDPRKVDFTQGTSRSGGSGYETTYMSSYAPSSCGTSAVRSYC